jgi:putative transposase
MPQPRNRQVSLEDTPYYHCISRCVRRAFLCGKDSHTGFNFEHRRQWIIARMANAEDHCTGRFWEGRFKSQALLDTRAVLACMAYVDLNPIRAAMASTPEQSDYTSIQERILHPEDSSLRPFAEQGDVGLPFALKDYLELVDWGGREIKHNKRGYIPASAPPILTRLKMDAAPVLNYLRKADQPTFSALGPVSMLRAFASSVGRSFIKGQSLGKRLFPETT